jgi:acetyltransferase-like isoleucine patch superfamily enzyme
LKKIGLLVLKIIGPRFFDKKFLVGRHFEGSNSGWTFVLRGLFWQKVMRINSKIPFPVNRNIVISNHENIEFHPDDLNNFQVFGVYYQNFDAKIIMGRGTYIAPNVGIITANHDIKDPDKHVEGKDVVIGEKCWIGMNSVVLPGVTLGDNTVVAAGSVVTKSFEDGYVVLAGVPAKIIKVIDKEE